MNLHHLAIFHAVAETGNITRAADKLMTGQPAVSRQLALLEKSLHTRLVDRLPRGIRLTQAGQLLASYAQRIFALDAEAQRALAELRGIERGSLTIGASLTIGSYILPPLLAQFRRLYPKIHPTLLIANTDDIQRRLLAGELDLGFTEGFINHDELHSDPFATDELVPIVSPDHPLASTRKPTARTFSKYPLILREPGSGTRAVVEHALRRAGITPTPVLSLGSAEAIKTSVAAGTGVAFVSRLSIAAELKAGLLATVPLADLKIHRDLHRLHPRGRTPTHAATAFLALLSHSLQTKPSPSHLRPS